MIGGVLVTALPLRCRQVPHPVPLPEFEVNLFWHAKFHKEPGNQWLRTVFADISAA